MPETDALLAEQIEYYRAYAFEYDDKWLLHLGNQNLDTGSGRQWIAEQRQLLDALDDFGPSGRVLEIAGGTGNYTQQLARHADSLTVLDSSPEALTISGRKLRDVECEIVYVVADIFAWAPTEVYDVVFFSFWLTHVPDDAFTSFWATVRHSLATGGRVFFLDHLVPLGVAADTIRAETHTPQEFEVPHTRDLVEQAVSIRELSNGRRFRIVKRFWTAEQLGEQLRALGWTAQVRTSRRSCGERRSPSHRRVPDRICATTCTASSQGTSNPRRGPRQLPGFGPAGWVKT